MPELIFLCFVGFCAGIIVAGGVSGLLIGLSIVPRYAGVTHTADYIFLYEDMSLLGTVAGTVVFLFHIPLPLGTWFLALCGVFFGIFLGGWILALAEIAKAFPWNVTRDPFNCCRKNLRFSSLLCTGLDVMYKTGCQNYQTDIRIQLFTFLRKEHFHAQYR